MEYLTHMINGTRRVWESSPAAKYVANIGPEYYVLQPLWDCMRIQYGDFCRSPLFPVVVNVSFYYLLNVPFMVMDLMGEKWPWVYKYKIQKDVKVTKAKVIDAILLNLYNNTLFILPMAILQWLYRPPVPLPELPPTVMELFLGVLGGMVIFDFQYFWWHYIHHKYRFLYKYVHRLHHEHNSPISWTTQYLSAPELLATGLMTSLNPVIFRQHFLTTTIAVLFNVFVSVEDHTGYDFPWSLSHLAPFESWGGAPKHDMHHLKPLSNFEPFFTYLDKIFGTGSDGGNCEALDPLKRQQWILEASNRDGDRERKST